MIRCMRGTLKAGDILSHFWRPLEVMWVGASPCALTPTHEGRTKNGASKMYTYAKHGRDPIVSRPGFINLPPPANQLRTRCNRVPTVFRVLRVLFPFSCRFSERVGANASCGCTCVQPYSIYLSQHTLILIQSRKILQQQPMHKYITTTYFAQ
jgi:hypothetical protein